MKIKILVLVFLIAAAFFFFFVYRKNGNEYNIVYFPKQNISLNVRLAENPSEWSRGLMFEKSFLENEGMLFVFPDEIPRQFWMKNMNFPLDIIFISADKTIVALKDNFAPCVSADCPSYQSSKPAKYVLEANAGFSEEHDLKIGQNIEIY